LTGITGKNIFRSNTNRIGLAGDNIRDIRARTDIIAGIDITITT
jgi:hypothetical protein